LTFAIIGILLERELVGFHELSGPATYLVEHFVDIVNKFSRQDIVAIDASSAQIQGLLPP
jgi:hypothetical protein